MLAALREGGKADYFDPSYMTGKCILSYRFPEVGLGKG